MENIKAGIKLKFAVSLCFIVLMTSCLKSYHPQYPVYYNVKNNTNSTIKIIFDGLKNPLRHSSYVYNVPDSIIFIDPGNERSLFVVLFSWDEKTNPETDDTLKGMQTLRIFRNDTIPANKNFLLTMYWEFYEPDTKKAELNLRVHTEDFN